MISAKYQVSISTGTTGSEFYGFSGKAPGAKSGLSYF